jgi:hypothetical protein
LLCKGLGSLYAVVGILLVTDALGSRAFAAEPVPEIDPSSAASALTFLFGSLLVLAHRRRK